MSNQVFSSNYHKYYDFPGLNNYGMTADSAAIATNASAEVIFNDTLIENDINNVTVSNLGHVTVDRDGMYSFMINLGHELSANQSTTSPDYKIVVTLDRPNEFTGLQLSSVRTRIAARGGTAGSEEFSEKMSFIIYLKQNDVLKIIVTNYAPETMVIKSATSNMVINKVY